MSVGRNDRNAINDLHDASNGRTWGEPSLDRPEPKWRGKPTIISVRKSFNPMSNAKLNDLGPPNRNGQNAATAPRQNPKTATVAPMYNSFGSSSSSNYDRPPKRQKTDNPFLAKPSKARMGISARRNSSPGGDSVTLVQDFKETSISGFSKRGPRKNAPGPSPKGQEPEVIDLEASDEEDIGQPLARSISSDILRINSNDTPPSSNARVGDILGVKDTKAFEQNRQSAEKSRATNAPSSSSFSMPNTELLKKRQQLTRGEGGDADDPIWDFDDPFDSPSAYKPRSSLPDDVHVIPRNLVHSKKRMFEIFVQPPHLDLVQMKKDKEKGKSRVGAMKSKNGEPPQSNLNGVLGKRPAPNAFSMDKPPAGSRLTKFTYKDQVVMRLKWLACGDHLLSSSESGHTTRDQFALIIRADEELLIRNDTASIDLLEMTNLNNNVACLIYCEESQSHDHSGSYLVGLKLSRDPNLPEGENSETYQILFQPLDDDVNRQAYSTIESKLRKLGGVAITYILESGLKVQFEEFERIKKNSEQSPKPRPRPRIKTRPIAGTPAKKSDDDREIFERRVMTRSARQPERRAPKRTPSPSGDELILLYPPTGTGAINITYADLKRLDAGEFLNDTLIELGLKLWLNELRAENPDLADQIHVFSSFFYTQLNQKDQEEGYKSVRKWTSKFDLFRKKYIIVPINEHLHWYLAIICYPEYTLQHAPPEPIPTPNVMTRGAQLITANASSPVPTASSRSTPPLLVSPITAVQDEQEVEDQIDALPVMRLSSLTPLLEDAADKSIRIPVETPRDSNKEEVAETDASSNAKGKDEDIDMNCHLSPPKFYGDPPKSKLRRARSETVDGNETIDEAGELADDDPMDIDIPPLTVTVHPEAALQTPYIFTFDSLGSRHPQALRVLGQYLEFEAKDKKQWEGPVSAQTKSASVPVQPNYCDCGIYLLHFVEQFMSDPDKFIERINGQKGKKSDRVEREELWAHAKVGGRRNALRERILELSAKWKEEYPEGKGKGKAVEGNPSEPPPETAKADSSDSDIEVLEVTPAPSKQKPAKQKAMRIR